jgi:cation diffusion facilitator family transporter
MNKKTNLFFFLPLLTNAVLFSVKLVFGILFQSLVLISDAINNVFDWISSILFAIGNKISIKKPDGNHPLGHGRAEYVTALILGTIMAMVGLQLLLEAIPLIFSPKNGTSQPFILFVVALSVLVKLALYLLFRSRFKVSKRISEKAIALDSLGDVFIGIIMIAGFALEFYVPQWAIEGWLSVLISIIIAWNGIRLAVKTSKDMLGRPLSETHRERIIVILKTYPVIQGMHSLVYHDYGPYHQHVSFHIELPSRLSLVESHNLIDDIEQKISQEMAFECLIHVDPLQEPTDKNHLLFKNIKTHLHQFNLDSSTILIKAIDEVLHPELIVYGLSFEQFKSVKDDLEETFKEYQFIYGDISFYS